MKRAPEVWAALSGLGQAPLAFFSLLWRRLTQVRILVLGCGRQYRRAPTDFHVWQVCSAQALESNLGQDSATSLARVMMVGPRWNTGAICASAGPFRVERELVIETDGLRAAAAYWSMLFFAVRGLERIAHRTSNDDVGPVLRVPPGDYFINLRIYAWRDAVPLPEILADGRPVAPAELVDAEVNTFYEQLEARSSVFYSSLNYYAMWAARWARFLPSRLVKQLLLPVGDPETTYRYGLVPRGQCLDVTLAPDILQDHYVFVTLYNPSSFPVQWYELHELVSQSEPCSEACLYVVRAVRHRGPRRRLEGFEVRVLARAAVAPGLLSSQRKQTA